MKTNKTMQIIDSHAHFWNPQKFNYPWIEPGSPFDRIFSLEDYQQATENIEIDKIVFVECDCTPTQSFGEVTWVEEIAKIDKRIAGIVAHVHLVDTEMQFIDINLERMASNRMVKGIRHNIQNTYPGFATQKSFIDGVKKVHRNNMHFELCITHDQLADTISLVEQCPEVRFVLDHCAKPGIKAGSKEPWMKQMKQMAEFENVSCKISGLLTEADWQKWTMDQILFYASYAATVFGTKRIMFGSDWPVNEVAGGYKKWFEATETLTQSWSLTEKEDFYFNNANRFYRLD